MQDFYPERIILKCGIAIFPQLKDLDSSAGDVRFYFFHGFELEKRPGR